MNKKIFLIVMILGIFMLAFITATATNTIWGKITRTGGNPSSDAMETTFTFEEEVDYCLAFYNCGLSGVELKIENSEDATILLKEKFNFADMKEGSLDTIKTGTLAPGEYKVTLTPYGKKDEYTTIFMPFKDGVFGCGIASSCY